MGDEVGQLTGKVALITGGGQGVGLGIALAFAAEGATLVITGRDAAKLEAAAEPLRASGTKIAVCAGDVSQLVVGDEEARIRVDRACCNETHYLDEKTRLVVVKCTENGKDVTEDARKDARTGNEKSKEERAKRYVELPLRASIQPRYVFDQIAVDPADPTLVEISFVPKEPNEHTSEGSAWIDTKTATLLSAGFKLSKPGFFVDYVHLTIELGAKTELGPAISKVTVDGKGGILFLRKHFRGEATLSDYRILP